MNGLSKRLVSLTMATAMVFSLTAVPATEAKAATASITSKTTSVQADKTYTYKIKAFKAKKVKVSVSGTAAKAVRVNGQKATSGITLKGGKTVTVKVKVNPSKTVAGKKFTINYKLDKKKAVKTKSIKVNYSTKGVTLDQTALTMKAGETATLKATMTTVGTNSKIKDWSSSNEAVATVKDGVVTAVAAGTADITVKTSNGKTATATVTVEGEKKTNLQMTSLTAVAADTLKATFAEAVPADAAIAVSRSKSTAGITGIATWNADRTELTYKLDGAFVTDVYTLTVKLGESSTSLTYEATARKATSIVIKDETALLSSNKRKAYVYYDVIDQYGESVRTSTSVNITSSGSDETTDRSTGRIEIDAASGTEFKYGDIVSVTIVDTKNGLSQSKVLTVGLEQQVDSVKVAGFINTDEPTKLLNTLPENFAKGKYVVLYQAYDQLGNQMPNNTSRLDATDKLLTVTVNDPMLIDSTFHDKGASYTIDGVTYDAFTINPGKYSDKGGETVLQIISNKTGTKTPYTVNVTSAGILQSFVLNAPSDTFADFENTVLTYTAKDTNGNEITDYETIVRSTNELTLNASTGTLTLYEGNDGEAVVRFADPFDGNRDLDDGIDVPVVLTTIVVGGETNNTQFGISDYAVPVAFKEINTKRFTNTIVYGGSETIDFEDAERKGSVKYVDQYGRVVDAWDAIYDLITYNNSAKRDVNYAIVMDTAGVEGANAGSFHLDETVIVPTDATWGNNTVNIAQAFNTDPNASDLTDSIKFYIGATANKSDPSAFAKLNAVSSQKTVTYTCVGYNKVKNIGLAEMNTLHVKDMYSSYANLKDFENKNSGVSVRGNGSLTITSVPCDRWVTVSGKANNETVYIPNTNYWSVDTSGDIDFSVTGGKITGVTGLVVDDLYKTSTSTGDRVSKKAPLKLNLAGISGNSIVEDLDKVETTVTIGDADSVATTIKFFNGWDQELKDTAVIDAKDTDLVGDIKVKDNKNCWVFGTDSDDWGRDVLKVQILDQYGDVIDYDTAKYQIKISDITESTALTAHVSNSFGTTANNTANPKVNGAEIKDSFKLTVVADGATASITVTVGGDWRASVDDQNQGKNSADYYFRTVVLNYTDR